MRNILSTQDVALINLKDLSTSMNPLERLWNIHKKLFLFFIVRIRTRAAGQHQTSSHDKIREYSDENKSNSPKMTQGYILSTYATLLVYILCDCLSALPSTHPINDDILGIFQSLSATNENTKPNKLNQSFQIENSSSKQFHHNTPFQTGQLNPQDHSFKPKIFENNLDVNNMDHGPKSLTLPETEKLLMEDFYPSIPDNMHERSFDEIQLLNQIFGEYDSVINECQVGTSNSQCLQTNKIDVEQWMDQHLINLPMSSFGGILEPCDNLAPQAISNAKGDSVPAKIDSPAYNSNIGFTKNKFSTHHHLKNIWSLTPRKIHSLNTFQVSEDCIPKKRPRFHDALYLNSGPGELTTHCDTQVISQSKRKVHYVYNNPATDIPNNGEMTRDLVIDQAMDSEIPPMMNLKTNSQDYHQPCIVDEIQDHHDANISGPQYDGYDGLFEGPHLLNQNLPGIESTVPNSENLSRYKQDIDPANKEISGFNKNLNKLKSDGYVKSPDPSMICSLRHAIDRVPCIQKNQMIPKPVGAPRHYMKGFLVDEGNLVLGKKPGVSSDLAEYFSWVFDKTILIHRKDMENSDKVKRLQVLFNTLRYGLIKGFFGGLQLLYQKGQYQTLDENVLVAGFEFIKVYFKGFEQMSLPEPNIVVKTHDWNGCQGIFTYLTSLKSLESWSSKLIWILLHNFSEWNLIQRRVAAVPFCKNTFIDRCNSLNTHRVSLYKFLEPPLGHQPKSGSVHGQKKHKCNFVDDTHRSRKVEMGKKFRCDQSNCLGIGRQVIGTTPYLWDSISSFFEDLEKDLLEDEDSFIDKSSLLTYGGGRRCKEGQCKKDVTFNILIDDAITLAQNYITPAFLGIIERFCRNRGNRPSSYSHINHRWEFLKHYFSTWKDRGHWGTFQDSVLLMVAGNPSYNPDLTNPRDCLYHCMLYAAVNVPPQRLVRYLSYQWIDIMIQHGAKFSEASRSNAINF